MQVHCSSGLSHDPPIFFPKLVSILTFISGLFLQWTYQCRSTGPRFVRCWAAVFRPWANHIPPGVPTTHWALAPGWAIKKWGWKHQKWWYGIIRYHGIKGLKWATLRKSSMASWEISAHNGGFNENIISNGGFSSKPCLISGGCWPGWTHIFLHVQVCCLQSLSLLYSHEPYFVYRRGLVLSGGVKFSSWQFRRNA